MDPLEPADLDGYAAALGAPLDGDSTAELFDRASALLRGVDEATAGVAVGTGGDGAGRTYRSPSSDPHDAIVTVCEVPLPPTHTDELSDLTVGVKDNIAVAGVPMGCGSAALDGLVPTEDASVVTRILNAGGRVVAKTNMDEFAGSAWGLTTGGWISNPRASGRTAGGSSGGSAAAVASGQVDVALGTDTGGSVRIPAAYCGVVGFKPTYGRVPLDGVVEYSRTLDHVGLIGSELADVAALFAVVEGDGLSDDVSGDGQPDGAGGQKGPIDAVTDTPRLDGRTFGILEAGFSDTVDPAVIDVVDTAIDSLVDGGATTRRVAVDGADEAGAIKNAIALPEFAAWFRDRGVPYRFDPTSSLAFHAQFASRLDMDATGPGPGVLPKLLAGYHLLAGTDGEAYVRGRIRRREIAKGMSDALSAVDAILFPTTPTVAPRFDEVDRPETAFGTNTYLANLTGQPAITVPCGTVDGAPAGLQLVTERAEDVELLALASAVLRTLSNGPDG